MFTFYAANNLYIIYFNKIRDSLTLDKKWPLKISSNIIITAIFFSLIITIVSVFIFDDVITTILIIPSLFLYIIIRNLSEFAKVDNSLFLSIFVEDVLFYVLFFVFSVVGVYVYNGFQIIVIALLLSLIITAVICLVLFKRKFNIKINTYKINIKDFSISDFKLGINYSFLRGNEVLSNFAVRYLGQIYFGDIFVAYAHIMYQFYNVFTLLTMSVISGFQSKITVKTQGELNKTFFNKMYLKIIKTISPFVLSVIIIIIIFNTQILTWFFPKYIEYNTLLVKVSFVGLLFLLIQPLVFILVYNNRFANIRALNFSQYFIMIVLYLLPIINKEFNQQNWLLVVMTSFMVVQGFYAILNYNKIR
ncbi:MAG: hypothetical protein ABJL44_18510 [Algibacter sp.]